jgi:hypothetical protein
MRVRLASLWLALLIVSIATVAVLVANPADVSDWPFLGAPMKPAWFLVFGLGGGPHGIAGEWYQGPATFAVAVAMWWGVFEGCRALWRASLGRRG